MAKRKIRELTTGVHDFPTLIGDRSRKYVDKTDLLYELAREETDAQYFISRPRRFGKSLMLSTLQAMFEGRRDLFKGLAIYDKPWEGWTAPAPAYSLTMSDANGDSYAEVKEQLGEIVDGLYEQAGLDIPSKGTIPGKFSKFLKAAAKKSPTKKIVVLVDEYDEPVAGFLDDLDALKRVRAIRPNCPTDRLGSKPQNPRSRHMRLRVLPRLRVSAQCTRLGCDDRAGVLNAKSRRNAEVPCDASREGAGGADCAQRKNPRPRSATPRRRHGCLWVPPSLRVEGCVGARVGGAGLEI